jgi:hypothetical protein
MRKIILIYIFLYPILSFSQVNEINSFTQLDSLWDTYKENDQFSFTSQLIRDNEVRLSDFYYYREISNYLNTIFNKDISILKVINAQNYGFYGKFNKECTIDYYFSPDVCFLYKRLKCNDIHLVYFDKKTKKVVDTTSDFFESNFEYLLKKSNYSGLKFEKKGMTKWIGSYEGTGISLNVYNNQKIFVSSISVFWKNYSDGLRIEFFNDEVEGKKATIKKLKQLLISLRTYIKFEDYDKDRQKKEKLIEKCLEYKKIRDQIIDVNEVDKRIQQYEEKNKIKK